MRRYLGIEKEKVVNPGVYKYDSHVRLNWPLPISFLWWQLKNDGKIVDPARLMDIPYSMLEDARFWDETERFCKMKQEMDKDTQ